MQSQSGNKQTDSLENMYVDNSKQIKELQNQNKKIVLDLIEMFHSVKLGDIVLNVNHAIKREDNKRIVIVRFEGIDWSAYHRTRKPWIYGRLIKKDGTCSERVICYYSEWEVLK